MLLLKLGPQLQGPWNKYSDINMPWVGRYIHAYIHTYMRKIQGVTISHLLYQWLHRGLEGPVVVGCALIEVDDYNMAFPS